MQKTYKVTVIGDIMSEPSLFAQAKRENGYDYTPVFENMKKLFSEADYVIGNLETPMAGEEAGYTKELVSFNTPDAIAYAVKDCGVDMVSTANNHALDRGIDGLRRTLKVLDEVGLAHTGTYDQGDCRDRIHYFTLGDTRLAVIAYTASTNGYDVPDPESIDRLCVNRIRPNKGLAPVMPKSAVLTDTRKFVEGLLGRKLIWEENIALKRATHSQIAYADWALEPEKYLPYVQQCAADLAEAKKNADLVLYLPHTGGQFNTEPGACSQYLCYRAVEDGADAVFAAHSHTTQCMKFLLGKPVFYSLGNVTMSPVSVYSCRETLPDYGIAAHIYVSEKKIVKTSFSLFKMVEDGNTPLYIIPVDELYEKLTDEKEKAKLVAETGAVWSRVTGRPEAEFVFGREFDL